MSYTPGSLLCLPSHLHRRGTPGYFLENPSSVEIKVSSSSADSDTIVVYAEEVCDVISENVDKISPKVLRRKYLNSTRSYRRQSQSEVNGLVTTTSPRNAKVKAINLISQKLSPVNLGIENSKNGRKRFRNEFDEAPVPRKRGRPFNTSIKASLKLDTPPLTTSKPKRKRISKSYSHFNLNSKSESSERRRPAQPKMQGNKTPPLEKSWENIVGKDSNSTPTRTNEFSKAPVARINKTSPSTVPREKDISDSEDTNVDVETVDSEDERSNLLAGVLQNQKITCVLCGKICKTMQALRMHHISHSDVKAYQCDECGNKFKFKSNLHNHVKIFHSGKKSFSCEICEESFDRSAELRMHGLLHSEKEPFKCSVLNCNKLYSSVLSLQKHQLRDHNSGTKLVLSPIPMRKLKLDSERSSKIKNMSSHRQIGDPLSSKSSKIVTVEPKSRTIKDLSKRRVIQDWSSDSENQSIVPENEESTPQKTPSGKIGDRPSSKGATRKKVKPQKKRRQMKVSSKPRKDWLWSSDSEEMIESVSNRSSPTETKKHNLEDEVVDLN